ncbi:hypothetical protein CBR_g34123 [Chara braunii]|uniref:Integrase catalytic domain-containing protein n=1 Tax=Chara braunii TaxID=69332 RepID=A0A388LHZ3_CHABU|nr:hypothetical protein CBR_g34123 [Chara braunii]|eukprot:GBG81940.1 hypothetical protein CBR_g34123 [Chara braunii]
MRDRATITDPLGRSMAERHMDVREEELEIEDLWRADEAVASAARMADDRDASHGNKSGAQGANATMTDEGRTSGLPAEDEVTMLRERIRVFEAGRGSTQAQRSLRQCSRWRVDMAWVRTEGTSGPSSVVVLHYRRMLQTRLDSWASGGLQQQYERLWARALFRAGVPFSFMRLETTQELHDCMVSLMRVTIGPPLVLPSYNDMRTRLLDEIYHEIAKRVAPKKAKWKLSGCTMMTDGAMTRSYKPVVNFIAAGEDRPVLITTVDMSERDKTGVALADLWEKVLAVVYAARHWRHYLHGAPFTVRTDNSVVQAFLTKPKLTPRQARWWCDLSEFSFTTEHIKGETNRVADALSRCADHDQEHIHLSSISVTTVHHSVIDEFRTQYRHCPDYRDIHAALRSGKTVLNYSLRDNGLVYWHGSQGTREPRICVPSTGQPRVRAVAEFHDQVAADHMGFHKTLARVSRLYVWPKCKDFVKDYVAECPTCQEVNSANHLPYGLLQPLPIPEGRWQSISMDFIGPLRPPTPRGHDAILLVVDRFTKRARFVPCRYAISAREVADIVFDRVVRDHGLPLSIISDRDPRFTSRFWRRLHEVYGTQLRFSSSYHPQTDGQTEITNRTLRDILRKIVRDDQQWDLHLAHAEIAYNHVVSPATGMSPYYCDLGYHPRVPADFLRPSQMHPDTSCPALDDWVAYMTSIMKTAHEHIAASQTRMAARGNRSRMDHPFKVGDDVLIDARHLQLEADTLRKFRRRFFGPCRILQAIGSDTASSPVSFRVKLPDYLRQARVHDVYHVSLVRPYRRRSERFAGRPYERPPPIMVDGHEEFLVSDIIGR